MSQESAGRLLGVHFYFRASFRPVQLGRPQPRRFFERHSVQVARDLVGCAVLRILPDGTRLVGRLTEVEAYLGDGSDPSSHAHNGETPRNRSMFGPPGRLYAYRSYGIHTCVNVVCEPKGVGAAVLLRSLEPLEGSDAMCALRGLPAGTRGRAVACGPGRLAQALGLGLEDDGISVLSGDLTLRPLRGRSQPRIVRGPRVGVGKAADLRYRFSEADSVWVSPWRPGRGRRS